MYEVWKVRKDKINIYDWVRHLYLRKWMLMRYNLYIICLFSWYGFYFGSIVICNYNFTASISLTLTFFLFQVQHYILVVQAQDSGHPSLSSTLTVYCNVLDLNDNAPVFDPMSYSNEILENVPINTHILSVSATDLDSGKYLGKSRHFLC